MENVHTVLLEDMKDIKITILSTFFRDSITSDGVNEHAFTHVRGKHCFQRSYGY